MVKIKEPASRTLKQQAIVDAAKKIIISKGFENLTVRAIARELKVTDGALYRHFKGKAEVISLLIDDVEKSLLTAIKKPAYLSEDPIINLWKIFLIHLSYAEQRQGMTLIIINESFTIRDKQIKKKMLNVMARYQDVVQGVLREGINIGKINKDVDVVAAGVTFFGMVQAAVTFWALSEYDYLLKNRTLERMFRQYMRGLCSK